VTCNHPRSGYRLIVRRDGPRVRLYTRNANDLTARLPAIAAAAERIEAKSFAIDGDAVVLGPDGLSRFDELQRQAAARTAILYAFDLIEHDGEGLRDRAFLDRKARLARLLRGVEAGILLNEHVAEDGPTVFEHACRLGAEGIVSKRVDGTYRSGPCAVWIKVRNPAIVAVQRERSERCDDQGRALSHHGRRPKGTHRVMCNESRSSHTVTERRYAGTRCRRASRRPVSPA
jgi:bifunctional non-homologous end joining protein LigD